MAVTFEGVSKRYRITQRRYRSLREDISELAEKVARPGKESESSDAIWALKDVSFKAEKGETLGIIGPNGAGKTTILKLLAKITIPTKGKICAEGRIAPLIEIGTGFHPELTGRENIYLYGSIMGMGRKEVAEKFDRIIGFAELERFVDTPLKRYSTGMCLRLGFSVIAHLEADVLLVDEVLAVGDMAFQRKCMQVMSELRNTNKIIIFVSHSMSAVESIADRVIWLDRGVVQKAGYPREVISSYIDWVNKSELGKLPAAEAMGLRMGSGEVRITKVSLLDESGNEKSEFKVKDKMRIRLDYNAFKRVERPNFGVSFWNDMGLRIYTLPANVHGFMPKFIESEGAVECFVQDLPFLPGRYFIRAAIASESGSYYDFVDRAKSFLVGVTDLYGDGTVVDSSWGVVYVPARWNFVGKHG